MSIFRNSIALITGAASGLGRQISLELARQECRLILLDHNPVGLESLRLECNFLQPAPEIHVIDLLDSEKLEVLLKQLVRDHPNLNIVINNAATVFGGSFEQVDFQQHRRTLELNFLSLLQITHFLLPHLRQQPSSRLVQVASASAFLSFPRAASYAASKWAVLGLSESLYAEQEDLGFDQPKITVACPSYIRTGLFRGAKAPIGSKVLDPNRLAQQILKASERGEFYLIQPRLIRFVPLLKALLPFRLWQRLLRAFGAYSGMKSWSGKSH